MTTIVRTCLNGSWDFRPLPSSTDPDPVLPQDGWAEAAYEVPSLWTKPTQGYRRPGDAWWQHKLPGGKYVADLADDGEFLYDSFEYPVAWSRTRSAWIRRRFNARRPAAGRRLHLRLDALLPRGRVFVNGRQVGASEHPTLPLVCDITEALRDGENEVAVLVADFHRDAQGRPRVPTGNTQIVHGAGLWQDVWLEERGAVQVAAVDLRTVGSRLTVRWTLVNRQDRAAAVTVAATVRAWVQGTFHDRHVPQPGPDLVRLPAAAGSIPAGGTLVLEAALEWPDAPRWEPHDPRLLQLVSSIQADGSLAEVHGERFGWREVAIQGSDLLLNGRPVHLFSDWGHRYSHLHWTEAWVRSWFAMIRAANMNHARLHTHPHPPWVAGLADELGILLTVETGLHGSGGDQGCAGEDYWRLAEEHVERLVERDRNHPSVILWSVCNEFRWNGVGVDRAVVELPRLKRRFNELDPTRPAYFEGDSSLWDERGQDLISRHYGPISSGQGWWDRRQPLHSGEFSLHHYGGPNNAFPLVGDRAWASYALQDAAWGDDCRMISEDARVNGVCTLGPWNLSCLVNLRPHGAHRFHWPDPSAPGVKPRVAYADSAEFRIWEPVPNWTPTPSFARHADGFRPLALIDTSRRAQAYAGAPWERTLHLVNDLPRPVAGTVTIALEDGGQVLCQASAPVTVAPGRRAATTLRLDLPAHRSGTLRYTARFVADDGAGDAWERPLNVGPRPHLAGLAVAVFGDPQGRLKPLWEGLGVAATAVASLEPAALAGVRVLVLAPRCVQPGTAMNRQIQAFARGGGRVLVLEQDVSPFPALPLEARTVHSAWGRAYGHPLLDGLPDDVLRFWGDAPYSHQGGGDHLVATHLYRKGDGTALAVIDAGSGGMGNGDLDRAAVLELVEGAGVVLACQLLVSERWTTIPAAARCLANLLTRAAHWQAPVAKPYRTVAGDDVDGIAAAMAAARAGATVLIDRPTDAALAAWGAALGVGLRHEAAQTCYAAVRQVDDPLLAGVSNEDTTGIEAWCYSDWSDPKPDNRPIATRPLAPVPGLRPLVVTDPAAGNERQFARFGKTEQLRAHSATQIARAAARTPSVILGEVACGAGRVLVSRWEPPARDSLTPWRPRYDRLLTRLAANHGHHGTASPLDGDQVPAAGNGTGSPAKLLVCTQPVTPEQAAKLRTATRRSGEMMWNKPVCEVAPFAPAEVGAWDDPAAGLDPGTAPVLWAYCLLESPIPRKNLAMDDGVPNPELMTILELAGDGEAELIVNERSYGTVRLQEGSAKFADVELEQGLNHLLLRWQPAGGRLRLRWRDLFGRAEGWFKFHT